jgi:hypothetical protein
MNKERKGQKPKRKAGKQTAPNPIIHRQVMWQL